MRRTFFWLVVVAVAFHFHNAYVAQSNSIVEGVVVEAGTDQPLEGVMVSAISSNGSRQAKTDALGRFSIELPLGERYRIAPFREGFVYAQPERLKAPREPGVWVVPRGRVNGIRLPMFRAGSISGRVVNVDGKVFPGVNGTVTLMRYRYDEYGLRKLATIPGVQYEPGNVSIVRMDDRGNYRFYGLPPGDYVVVARIPGEVGYYPGGSAEASAVPVRVEIGADVQLNTLTLPRAKTTYPVRFVLADQANKPLAPDVRLLTPLTLRNRLGTSLIITGSADERSSDPSIPMVRTASFPEGEHELQLGLSWQTELYYADLKINVTNPGIDQPVQMVRGPSLSGTLLVIGPNGNQAKPAELFCKLRSEAPYHQTAFASSSRGGCLSARFTPGKYHLEVEGVPRDAYVASA